MFLSLSQGMASDRRLSTTALHMQNSVPRARDIKTLQHTEIFKMKNPLDGRERWKHAGSRCMGGERFVTAAFEHTVADWHGPCLLHAQPATHQLPSTAGSLTQLVPRGWDPHQSWPGGEGCIGPPRRRSLPLLLFPQTRRQFSSPPHGHPCRDGSGTCHPQGPQGTSKAEPRDPAKG